MRIRERARNRDLRDRAAAIGLTSLIAAIGGSSTLAPRAGATISNAIRVWISGGTAAIDVRGLVVTKNPTGADLAAVAARASFPVVYPIGLPARLRVHQVMFSPAERPTTVTILYRSASGAALGFTLVDAAAVDPGAPPSGRFSTRVVRWRIGREEVIAPIAQSAVRDAIERAMLAGTPAASLAANALLAAHVRNLGASLALQTRAERLATGGGTLLDPRHLGQIPSLAREEAPLRDDRTVTLSEIPQIRGAPDYRRAKLAFSRDVALSVPEVKELAAYLRDHRLDPQTAVLFQPHARGNARITALR